MPSIAVKRKYEAIYILKPDATDEVINTTIQRYKHVVENAGGAIEKTGVWERRKLAYEIKGYTEGIYVILNFIGEAPVEAELRRIFQINSGEDQIRYMIVKPEEGEATGRAVTELTENFQRPTAPAPAPAVVEAVAPAVVEAPAPAVVEVVAEAPVAVEVVAETPAVVEVVAEAPVAETPVAEAAPDVEVVAAEEPTPVA